MHPIGILSEKKKKTPDKIEKISKKKRKNIQKKSKKSSEKIEKISRQHRKKLQKNLEINPPKSLASR